MKALAIASALALALPASAATAQVIDMEDIPTCWPLVAYGTNYDGTSIYDSRTTLEGTEQPRYCWDPAIAPGGMTFYSGDLVPEWKNDLFVAALAGQHLARLVVRGDRIVGEERLLQDQKQRIRDVKQGPDGALWVITDDAAGRLLRIAPPADAL